MILHPRGKLEAPRNPKVLITYYMDDLIVPGFWGTVGVYNLIWSRLDFVVNFVPSASRQTGSMPITGSLVAI